jgi:hypothetical protein
VRPIVDAEAADRLDGRAGRVGENHQLASPCAHDPRHHCLVEPRRRCNRQKRMTRIAVLVVLGVLAAGCSSTTPSARVTAPSTTAATTSAVLTPRDAAIALGHRMLGQAVLPPGTAPLTGAPPAVLRGPATVPAMGNLVFGHRLWTVNEEPHAVWQWLQAHVPAGFSKLETSSGTDRGVPSWGVEDDLAVEPQNISTAELQLRTAGDSSGHAVIRVDTVVGWTAPRPSDSFVPAGDRTAVVSVIHSGVGSPAGGKKVGKRVVTSDPKLVGPLVRAFNRLRVAPPDTVTNCPEIGAHSVAYRVAFAASSTATPDVIATVGLCGPIEVVVHGRAGPALQEVPAQSFATSAAHVLGLQQPHFG